MLISRSEFERLFLRFKAPHMLPAQIVHAVLMVLTTSTMFSVDAKAIFEARARGEDVDLLITVGIGGCFVSACGLAVLTVLYFRRKTTSGPVSETGAVVQDTTAVIVWINMVIFLEVVQAFAKGSSISSWAFVIAGFLRTHMLHNLLCNGLAMHPQPLGFLVGVFFLVAARVLSHIMWDQRDSAGQLVTMMSAQCGETDEWKPRGLISVLVIVAMTTSAYLKRQIMERSGLFCFILVSFASVLVTVASVSVFFLHSRSILTLDHATLSCAAISGHGRAARACLRDRIVFAATTRDLEAG
jgi:hypothetical protein